MIWLPQVSYDQSPTTKGTGARLYTYSAYRSEAQRPLEQCSKGMIGAVLYDRLGGAKIDSQG